MPNHVENRIRLDGDPVAIKAMLEAIQNDELGLGTVDFNKIIPMPESMDIEAGSRTDKGLKAYKDFVEVYTLCSTINMDKGQRCLRQMIISINAENQAAVHSSVVQRNITADSVPLLLQFRHIGKCFQQA